MYLPVTQLPFLMFNTFFNLFQAFTPEDEAARGNLGLTLVNPKLSAVQGLGVEFFLGFVLVLVVFAVCDPHRAPHTVSPPLAIGLTVAVGHLTAVSNFIHRYLYTTE